MADLVQPSAKQRTGAAIAAACLVCAPLTATFEGLRTHPYRDPAPKHTLTVCYGDTQVAMRVYTPSECLILLSARQRSDYAPGVLKCVPGLIDAARRNVFAAAIDTAYNAGVGKMANRLRGFCGSPAAILFRAGQWAAGCAAIRGWHTLPGTKAHNGLVRRREAERALCLKGAA